MISVASASFSSRNTTPRSALYPGVTAPCAMCSRARLRRVWMSERNAPATSVLLRLFRSRRRRAAGRRALLVVLRVRRLFRGALGAIALDLRLLDARVLGFALLVVALLRGDVVGGFGLGFAHMLLRLRLVLVVLGVELGLGDLLLAFRLGHADVLGVGLERVALGLVGFRLRFDALVLGLVDLALVHLLRLRGSRERDPHGQRDA